MSSSCAIMSTIDCVSFVVRAGQTAGGDGDQESLY